MFNVFHELHYIVSQPELKNSNSLEQIGLDVLRVRYQKRLYQTLHPQYYFPNATQAEIDTNREHNSTQDPFSARPRMQPPIDMMVSVLTYPQCTVLRFSAWERPVGVMFPLSLICGQTSMLRQLSTRLHRINVSTSAKLWTFLVITSSTSSKRTTSSTQSLVRNRSSLGRVPRYSH